MSRANAIQIFLAGVESVKPLHFIPAHIQLRADAITVCDQTLVLSEISNLYIVSVGKAAPAMALETEKIIGDYITKGIVVTKYHHALVLTHCRTIEAGHPVPDDNSMASGKEVVQLFKEAKQKDIIILLISGGASALLADSPPGCSLQDIQHTVQLLLDCGAAIDEINTVRKHLSLIKGGQLMQYTSAKVMALILSDVPGNDLSVIASGLTVPDTTTFKDAWQVIENYQLAPKLPYAIKDWLLKGIKGSIADTPKAGNPAFNKVYNSLVATNKTALEGAAAKARLLGYATRIISPMLLGEADVAAGTFINHLKNDEGNGPVCILWGGETTVTIRGTGKGGRNQQFALAALSAMKDDHWLIKNSAVILSGGTDGTDGTTTATGAVIDKDTLIKVNEYSLSPTHYLYNNDAYHFFEQAGGLIITGPTQTNVMDIVVGLIKKMPQQKLLPQPTNL